MARVLTAIVLIPTVIYIVFAGPQWLFQLVVALMAIACFHEFTFIAHSQQVRVPVWVGHALGLTVLFMPQADWRILLAMTMILMIWSLRLESLADALPSTSGTILGVLYIYGAWRCAGVLREASPWWLLYALSINWVGDTAAMVAGKTVGKHKLAPEVSPKKTWEGAIASALVGSVYGAVLLTQTIPQFDWWRAALLSLATGIAGQVGDLVESAMKRGANVKDSGSMLPGHGGWLDRLDSTLFAMPVVAFYLRGMM